ncbi:hypothetical protein NFJ02_30g76370 [Pycnococcus provasolii]
MPDVTRRVFVSPLSILSIIRSPLVWIQPPLLCRLLSSCQHFSLTITNHQQAQA